MFVRTKIICTMGPSVSSYEKLCELVDSGMSVARLNFSHGSHESHAKTIELLKRVRKEKEVPLSIMLDTKGPEVRIGTLAKELSLKKGDRLKLVAQPVIGSLEAIQLTPKVALDALKKGMILLLDDGYISALVVENKPDEVIIEIQNPGVLKSHKGVNLPGVEIDLPAMTNQDKLDIAFGCVQDVDLIAASFIRSADHVKEIKALLKEQKKPDIQVIAKIENALGVKNFDEIVAVADGIMVARGDLGVELPLEQVPWLQKKMIGRCHEVIKPVVTATQMLESMIHNPRPTRAEVSDVANAIYDSTSSVMLSGETAAGAYPVESVRIMRGIALEAENHFDFEAFFNKNKMQSYSNISFSIALSAVSTAYSASAKAIFCFTHGGFTARALSRFRPKIPIIALTESEKVYNQLAFNWGVIPLLLEPAKDLTIAFETARSFALKKGLIQTSDLVVVTTGEPFWKAGTTNVMIVKTI